MQTTLKRMASKVSSSIEIAGSPEQVRQVFMEFRQMPEWTQGFIKSIAPATEKATIEKGDKLTVALQGMTFSPTVLENSERAFVWRGSMWGLFNGDHAFRFEPSKTTPGSTTFSQSEEFSGPLAFLTKLSSGMDEKAQEGFGGFNNDLKRRVESSK